MQFIKTPDISSSINHSGKKITGQFQEIIKGGVGGGCYNNLWALIEPFPQAENRSSKYLMLPLYGIHICIEHFV